MQQKYSNQNDKWWMPMKLVFLLLEVQQNIIEIQSEQNFCLIDVFNKFKILTFPQQI
jgi:hypothetical protein